jgi:hypothetical protein
MSVVVVGEIRQLRTCLIDLGWIKRVKSLRCYCYGHDKM